MANKMEKANDFFKAFLDFNYTIEVLGINSYMGYNNRYVVFFSIGYNGDAEMVGFNIEMKEQVVEKWKEENEKWQDDTEVGVFCYRESGYRGEFEGKTKFLCNHDHSVHECRWALKEMAE